MQGTLPFRMDHPLNNSQYSNSHSIGIWRGFIPSYSSLFPLFPGAAAPPVPQIPISRDFPKELPGPPGPSEKLELFPSELFQKKPGIAADPGSSLGHLWNSMGVAELYFPRMLQAGLGHSRDPGAARVFLGIPSKHPTYPSPPEAGAIPCSPSVYQEILEWNPRMQRGVGKGNPRGWDGQGTSRKIQMDPSGRQPTPGDFSSIPRKRKEWLGEGTIKPSAFLESHPKVFLGYHGICSFSQEFNPCFSQESPLISKFSLDSAGSAHPQEF